MNYTSNISDDTNNETWIKNLNTYLGDFKGKLGLVSGTMDIPKTSILISMGLGALNDKLKVLHIDQEETVLNMYGKYYAGVSELDVEEIINNISFSDLEYVSECFKDRLTIKGALSLPELDAYLTTNPQDLIIYPNVVHLKDLDTLKNLANKYNVPIWIKNKSNLDNDGNKPLLKNIGAELYVIKENHINGSTMFSFDILTPDRPPAKMNVVLNPKTHIIE